MADLSDERLLELIEGSEDDLTLSGYRTQSEIRDTLAALRELQRLREQVRWRPMEEAPKDGAKILVRSPTNNVYVAMRGGSAGGAIGNWLTTPGAWLINNPTGWMPLPEIGPLPGGDA